MTSLDPIGHSDRLLSLVIDGAPHPVSVVSLRGRERMSKTFSFDISVLGPSIDPESIEEHYVGALAHLSIQRADGERWIHGVILRMAADGRAQESDDARAYRVRLVPNLRLLGLKRNSRIFQDKSAAQIVESLLLASGVSVRSSGAGGSPVRAYCVQHQETDLDFIERLLAEDGILYWFEHPPGERASEIVVLGHSPEEHRPADGDAPFKVARQSDMVRADDHSLDAFELEHRLQSGRVLLRGFDFERPSFDLKDEAKTADLADPLRGARRGASSSSSSSSAVSSSAQAAVASIGVLAPTDFLNPKELEQYHHDFGELDLGGAKLARAKLERHRRKSWVAVGASRCAALQPGSTITIDDAQLERAPARYTLVEVTHEGANPGALVSGSRPDAVYRNEFLAVPATIPFRPKTRPERPQQILESATVVGPPGQEIHTDERGRVLVQFHWDREGKKQGDSSCWIRVLQPWAGAGWGFQFIPRVGMEVMVAFLAGDPDRPVILGSVYDAEHPPTFPLPAERAKSGIRTRSTPRSQGYSELSFDDKAGEETVSLRAQRHFDETVLVNHSTKVGNDRTLVVEGRETASVGGDSSLSVTGNRLEIVRKNRSESTMGNASLSVRGNSTERVTGNKRVTVEGSSRAQITGAAVTRVDGDAALAVAGGLSVNVGARDGEMGVLHAKGSWVLGSDEEVIVQSPKSISLVCGSSSVRITPDKIEIASAEVAVRGDDRATVFGGGTSLLELAKEAKLASDATRLFGKTSSLELSTNAYIKGLQIKLNASEGDPPQADPESPAPPTRTLSLKLSDAGFQAMPNRPYEMTVDGVRYKGTTDGAGNVNQDIPETATKASLLVWEGDPPTGKSHVWDLVLKSPPSASSLEGARTRLSNLGYEVGSGSRLDPTTKRAIVDFQRDHDLDPTGELDAPTTSKLSSVHGY
ncbi:MAG: type VI secretion system tip protein TssI/VgrG [Polyangiaceae bacterium]